MERALSELPRPGAERKLGVGDESLLVAVACSKSLKCHFTPKHASWLNMVEIEIWVMVRQCLDRRIPDKSPLISEIAQWERRRNREGAGIDWMFTVDRARAKLGRAYPAPAGHPVRRALRAAA